MLPSGELLVRRVDDEDKFRSYQCRAVNRLTGTTLLSGGRAKFSVTGEPLTMRSHLFAYLAICSYSSSTELGTSAQ
jgi:hypothetical protein